MANLGLQNKNPGNLRDPATGNFRVFDTPEAGHQALVDDIKLKQSGQSSHIKPGASIEDFANVWAPPSDNNDSHNYAKTLARVLGVNTAYAFDQVPADKLAGAIKVAEGTTALPDSPLAPAQKLSVDAFAAKIKAKYPGSYDDIDSATLTQKILSKYPEYGDMVDTSAARAISEKGVQPNPSGTGTNENGLPNFKLNNNSVVDGIGTTDGSTPQQFQGSILHDFGNVGKGFISGTLESGRDIAAAIGGNTMAETFNALPESDQHYLGTLIQLRNKAAAEKNKTKVSHFQDLIKSYKTTDGESITDVFPALNKSTEQVIGDFASMALETVGAADAATGVAGLAGFGAKTGGEAVVDSFGKRLAKGAATQGAFGAGFGTAGAMQNNDSLEDVGKSAATGLGLGVVTGLATEGAVTGLKTAFGAGRSAEELAQIAEKDVHKLPAREQKEWYRQQSVVAKQRVDDLSFKTKASAEQSLAETKDQIQNINQQIGQSTREEAVNLKPKAQQVMKDASQEYLSLTGEAADGSPALSKTMTHEDLASKIDEAFKDTEHSDNSAIRDSLKQELGISTKSSAPLPEGETPAQKEFTNKEILDKARAIMQDVSKSARSGGRVYTPEEYEAIKKYAFLMDTLGENGVDMTAANKFWREYAPIRDRMVREIKPFDEGDTGKMSFTTTINNASSVAKTSKQAASKLDAQNFIKQLETRMKLPEGTIGKETRDLVEGLEKAKLSKENIKKATDEALAQIKADKVKALETMKLSQYNAEAAARRRKIIKIVLGGILGYTALKEAPVIGPIIKAGAAATGL